MCTSRFLFIILFSLLIPINLTPVVILVHGSFASSSTWHSTNGAFFKSLEESAKSLNHPVVTFNWSGTPSFKEIQKAGKMLAKLILSYPQNTKFILVGHSHGGNVINIASQQLYNIEDDILERASHINAQDLEKALSDKQKSATNPVNIQANKQNPEFDFIVTTRKPEVTHRYKIDCVYLLGTPVDTKTYAPQMNVIQYLFNFYSEGDDVQAVVGFYNTQYPKHERITNIQLKIRDPQTNQDYRPSHRGTHHSIIGSWLLFIPFKLQKEKIAEFKNFELGKSYTMIFREKDYPLIFTN